MGETGLAGKLSKKVGGSNPNAATLTFRYETAVTIERTSGCLIVLYYNHVSGTESVNIIPATSIKATLHQPYTV